MKSWQSVMGRVKDRLSKKSIKEQQSPQLQPLPQQPKQPKQLLTNHTTTSSSETPWLELRFHDGDGVSIMKPKELEDEMKPPPPSAIDPALLDKIQGSMIGMALGDALGAHVEFRPREYLVANPVTRLQGGGTWGLKKGQFTDDTSMALCLANSLVTQRNFNLYDQLVRYKWWFRLGYMSSTGQCFDIGAATSNSLTEFESRQQSYAKSNKIPVTHMDTLSDPDLLKRFDVYCSYEGVAGNGALMRLAPVPLFFFRSPEVAVEYSGHSGVITHGDRKAYDACRYYGALIVAALRGYTKDQLLSKKFYSKHKGWFGNDELCNEIKTIAEGSYRREGGYNDGIRGKGYIVDALEAALWAFWSDGGSFERGALAAVNLGDDTDTTAAIYGQLAGAHYGYSALPRQWLKEVYAKKFMCNLSEWIGYEGERWQPSETTSSVILPISAQLLSDQPTDETLVPESNLNIYPSRNQGIVPQETSSKQSENPTINGRQRSARQSSTDPVTFAEQATSTSRSSANLNFPNNNGTNLVVTSEARPQKRNKERSSKKLNTPMNGTQTEGSMVLNNSSEYSGQQLQEENQRETYLRVTVSVSDTNTLSPSRTARTNPRPLDRNNRDFNYNENLQSVSKESRKPRTMPVPSGSSPKPLKLAQQSIVKKNNDEIVYDSSQGETASPSLLRQGGKNQKERRKSNSSRKHPLVPPNQ